MITGRYVCCLDFFKIFIFYFLFFVSLKVLDDSTILLNVNIIWSVQICSFYRHFWQRDEVTEAHFCFLDNNLGNNLIHVGQEPASESLVSAPSLKKKKKNLLTLDQSMFRGPIYVTSKIFCVFMCRLLFWCSSF